jgi:hypothetical protein
MKSSLFALCMLCAISAAFGARHLTDIDLDDTCCAAITFTNRTGSLLVAREDDRDDCEIDDDDDDRRVYTYALYKDNTCYVESSYPCSRFVRDGNNNDDDYSRTCTTAEAADYNTKFAAAVQELRTQAQTASSSPPQAGNNDDDDDDDDDDNDDDNDGDDNDDDDDDDDNRRTRTTAQFCTACQSKCQLLCQATELTSNGAPFATQCYVCGNANGACNCGSTTTTG